MPGNETNSKKTTALNTCMTSVVPSLHAVHMGIHKKRELSLITLSSTLVGIYKVYLIYSHCDCLYGQKALMNVKVCFQT